MLHQSSREGTNMRLLGLCLCVLMLPVLAIGGKNRENDNREYLIGSSFMGKEIKIVMEYGKFPVIYKRKEKDRPNPGFLGNVRDNPKVIITSMKLSIGDRTVILPFSAYADLSEVRDITAISKNKKGFVLQISGGDAASSYQVRMHFTDGRLVKRVVYVGENENALKNEIIEYTVYANGNSD